MVSCEHEPTRAAACSAACIYRRSAQPSSVAAVSRGEGCTQPAPMLTRVLHMRDLGREPLARTHVRHAPNRRRWQCVEGTCRNPAATANGCCTVNPVLHCGQEPRVHNRTETQRRPLGPKARAWTAQHTVRSGALPLAHTTHSFPTTSTAASIGSEPLGHMVHCHPA